MTTVLNALLDVFLGASLVAFVAALINMVAREPDRAERTYQAMAMAGGAIAALGAQASGSGFASYTVDSLTGVRPGGAIFKAVAVAVPGGVAAAFGWYFLRVMRRSAARALRFMAFIGMLSAIGFLEIFAVATKTKGVSLGAAAIPNASFVLGMILSIVFFAPEPGERGGGSGGRMSGLKQVLRGRVPRAARQFMAPVPSTGGQPPRSNGNPWTADMED